MKAAKTEKKGAKVASSMPISHGVGRRKSAVARVWLRKGNGVVEVNGKACDEYFDTELTRLAVRAPFAVLAEASYNVEANVQGGGRTGQADAIKLGIARAILELNPELRPTLREFGFLTVDSRLKERKKYGQRGARRKFQFVKR